MRKHTFTVRRTPQNWSDVVDAINKMCGVAVMQVTERSVTVLMASSISAKAVDDLIDRVADMRAVKDAEQVCVL